MKSIKYNIEPTHISLLCNIDNDFELDLTIKTDLSCKYKVSDIADSNFILISAENKSLKDLNYDLNQKFREYKFKIKQRSEDEICISNYDITDEYTHKMILLLSDGEFDSVFVISQEEAMFIEEDNCNLV